MKPFNVFFVIAALLLSTTLALTLVAGEAAVQAIDAAAKRITPGQQHRRLSNRKPQARSTYASCSQDVELVNHCLGGSRGECQGTVNAYIYGWNNGHLTFVGPDSQFYMPQEVGAINQDRIAIPIPQGQSVNIHMPDCLGQGRIAFISNGEQLHYAGNTGGAQQAFRQPSETNTNDANANSYWAFMEFTTSSAQGLTMNPSQVDFAGLPIALTLEHPNSDGDPHFTGGMRADAVASICESLSEQAKADGLPWDQLCTRSQDGGSFVRALSPNAFIQGIDKTAFEHYWEPYVDQVWEQYRGQDLVFDVASLGHQTCRVGGDDQLRCANDSILISKPSSSDIFSCATGPFAQTGHALRDGITARLCAAFVRSTAHTGHVQPCDALGPDQYYQQSPTNYFSKFVHQVSQGGKGYAFAYDWVNPPSAPTDVMSHGQWTEAHPGKLTVTVGGWR